MKSERFTVQACCGKTSIIFKLDRPLSELHVKQLIERGFFEHKHFTKAGIVYIDNLDFIVTAPLGANKLQVKCKHKNCNNKFDELEVLFQQLG